MQCKIRLLNHTGDQEIAQYDPADATSVQVAQEELTKFLEECVRTRGSEPPVWGRRSGQKEFEPMESNLSEYEEVLLQYPLAGG